MLTCWLCSIAGSSVAGCEPWIGPSLAFSRSATQAVIRWCCWRQPWPAISWGMGMCVWTWVRRLLSLTLLCRCHLKAMFWQALCCYRHNCLNDWRWAPGCNIWPAAVWSPMVPAVNKPHGRWYSAASACTCVATGPMSGRSTTPCANAWNSLNRHLQTCLHAWPSCLPAAASRVWWTGKNWLAPWPPVERSASLPAARVLARPPPWCACWRCSRPQR
ncbi:hypothetical protein D3C77_346270 [compost metagenome]